ncbi:MAG: carbohydrate ABC transporter permease [Rhodoglobus sp.]
MRRLVSTLPRLARILILALFAIYFLVPLVWLVLAPTKTDAQLVDLAPFSVGSWENVLTAANNLMAYNGTVMAQWFANSALYSIGSLLITVTTALAAGYALAVLDPPFRRSVLALTLVAMIVPPTALVLPLFLEFNAVGLTNTAWSVILPASFFPFATYLAFIYFSTSLPRELLEAGRLDGCGELGLFTRIALPLATPLVGLVAFFSFVANWNNYFLPYVMLSEESSYNLPVGLGALISGTPALNPGAGGSLLPIHRPEIALAGILVVAPVALVFIISQRFLVRGILDGSVKS